jgi:hypothetical protein
MVLGTLLSIIIIIVIVIVIIALINFVFQSDVVIPIAIDHFRISYILKEILLSMN